MKSSAVLLIDLENFYCSREEFLLKNGAAAYDKKAFAADLERLLHHAREMVRPLPFIVRRAYANFNASHFEEATDGRRFDLRDIPDELMKQGVEPVQVFRLAQGGRGGKHAADMRMAMEASALLASAAHVKHFVLVTGDTDFVPVVFEIKRHGHAVSLIGVTNATDGLIQRFVDRFELFEDLLATAGPHSQPQPTEAAVNLADPQLPPEPKPQPEPKAALAPDEAHTAEGYTKLLRAGGPSGCETEGMKVPPVPWPVVERVCDAAFAALSPSRGGRPTPWEDLHDRLIEAADGETGDPDRHVRRVLGMLRTAELTTERDDLLFLRDDIHSTEELRWRVLMFALSLLHYRLGERGISGPIRPEAFAESLDAGPLAGRIAAEVAPVIPQLGTEEPRLPEQPAAPEPTPEPPPAAPAKAEAEEDEVPIGTAEAFNGEPEGVTPSLLSNPLKIDPAVLAEDGEPEPEPEPKLATASGAVPDDDDDEIDLGALQLPPGESPSAVIKLGTKKIVIEPIRAGEWIAGTDGPPEDDPVEPEPDADPAPESRPPHPPEFA